MQLIYDKCIADLKQNKEINIQPLVEPTLDFLLEKVKLITNKAYSSPDQLDFSSFKEESKIVIKKSLETFFLKKKHWEKDDASSKDVLSYIIGAISNHAKAIRNSIDSQARYAILICPLCKLDNRKEILVKEDKLWKCDHCWKEWESAKVLSEKVLFDSFKLHSRSGFKCPECNRFLPASAIGDTLSCLYSDCLFMGHKKDLEPMAHPSFLGTRNLLYISNQKDEDDKSDFDIVDSGAYSDAYACVCVSEQLKAEHTMISDIISEKISLLKRTNRESTLNQKILMHQAFKQMLDECPEDMIPYLVRLKKKFDIPLQPRIFQKYIKLIENNLPISFIRANKKIDIIDLLDPNLSLFLGESEFESVVDVNLMARNNTKEEYVGRTTFKNYGPCFLGKILEVNDEKGNSILDKIKWHSFNQIHFDNSVSPGTKIFVKHYRIPSHYENKSMIFLQSVRRDLVDKIYFTLNNKKREIEK